MPKKSPHDEQPLIQQLRLLVKRRAVIDPVELVPEFDRLGLFDAEFEEVERRWKLHRMEELIRHLVGKDGHREWGHIKEHDKEGNERTRYYQLRLCDPPKLYRVRDYNITQAFAYMGTANHIQKLINQKLPKPQPLPFPGIDQEEDVA